MIENRSFQRRLDVVRVRDVEKFYGSPVNPMMVLNKLNMTVMSGSMYELFIISHFKDSLIFDFK